MADKKPEEYYVAAFAQAEHMQQKYLVFDLAVANEDRRLKRRGAERHLPFIASHEFFHALGFDHPRTEARKGEALNSRTWEQLQQDIAANLTKENALGSFDPATGIRTITFSFAAKPTQVQHGRADWQNFMRTDANSIPAENLASLAPGPDAARNDTNQHVKEVMLETFALHSSLFRVKLVEATDPASANILIYTANIPPKKYLMQQFARGRDNAFNQDVTTLAYANAEAGIFPNVAVGELYIGQKIYGLPLDQPGRGIFNDTRLTEHAGVMWDNQPMAIKLSGSPMLGALTVNMGAHPYQPAITGTLRDAQGPLRVRQHIGANAILNEFDASDTAIALDITGTDNANIKVGTNSIVRLRGKSNAVTLGPGPDTVIHDKGFGHVLNNLCPEDTIKSPTATKVRMQHWSSLPDPGTLVTFLKDDTHATGSLFVRASDPETVMKQLQNLPLQELKTAAPVNLPLNALDGDTFLRTAPRQAIYHEKSDVAVSAEWAAGRSVSNLDSGSLIVKMTRPQYESRTVTWNPTGRHYVVTFRENGQVRTTHLQDEAKIAVQDNEGHIEKIISLPDAQKEADLASALRKGSTAESIAMALPLLVNAARQRG